MKDKKDLRIIFLGNPEFARYHLKRILKAGYNVVAVISAPDKPGGRGLKMNATPVTQFARENDIPCLQPRNLKNPEFQQELASYKADLQVVIAFRMLPESVWDMPPLGTFNLHASLLPQYRGAAPINWAIINGETQTGVSTFKLKHEIDTGNLIVQKTCDITTEDNAGSLHDKLMYLGADAMLETLDQISSGEVEEIPQEMGEDLKSAPKLYTENTEIEWNKSGSNVINFIRGLNPYPVAHSKLGDRKLQVYEGHFSSDYQKEKPGVFYSDNKKYLAVSVLDGVVFLNSIKLQGKRKMAISDFLNGYDTTGLSNL